MLNHILYALTASRPVRHIKLDSGPYLERYYLGQWRGITFYLHRFVSEDTERHLHNHPWGWGQSVILSGGYTESVATDICPSAGPSGCTVETRKVRWFNRVDGNHFHRIGEAEPGTWSLFFHGPRSRVRVGSASVAKGWGFLERKGDRTEFMPWPSANTNWWTTAPLGRESGRVKL